MHSACTPHLVFVGLPPPPRDGVLSKHPVDGTLSPQQPVCVGRTRERLQPPLGPQVTFCLLERPDRVVCEGTVPPHALREEVRVG